jgi:hypothetical protein
MTPSLVVLQQARGLGVRRLGRQRWCDTSRTVPEIGVYNVRGGKGQVRGCDHWHSLCTYDQRLRN